MALAGGAEVERARCLGDSASVRIEVSQSRLALTAACKTVDLPLQYPACHCLMKVECVWNCFVCLEVFETRCL